MKQRELFVEEDLLRSYFKMVAFIQQTESHMMTSSSSSNGGGRSNSSSSNILNLNEAVVESLLRDFALNWKRDIEQINKNVLECFSNFRNGTGMSNIYILR